MQEKFTPLTPALYRYLIEHASPRDPVLDALAEETARLGDISVMQIAPEQGALMTLLVRALRVRSAIEVGTFTGYSAIAIARGLPADGRLIACDVSEEWTAIARTYFARAGVADRIDLRIAPAIETLRALPPETVFDFGFIDADKIGYPAYYEEIVSRLRPDGLLLLDNVLWMGQVSDPRDQSESTRAIREVNDRAASDPRVETVMISVADGITLIRKRTAAEVSSAPGTGAAG
jgi:caffeoyl-CoA O-methyltransferase